MCLLLCISLFSLSKLFLDGWSDCFKNLHGVTKDYFGVTDPTGDCQNLYIFTESPRFHPLGSQRFDVSIQKPFLLSTFFLEIQEN